MKMMNEITSDHISRAVGEIAKIKPDYRLLLGLYEKIFIEQERSKKAVHLGDLRIPDETLHLKQKEKFPLVETSRFVVDNEAAGALFIALCAILEEAGGEISESVRKLKDAAGNNRFVPSDLFAAFLGGDDAVLKDIENEYAINGRILAFLIYNSIKPSLNLFSAAMSGYLGEDEWDRGYCPVCGSMPELSIFEEKGKRSLLCGFCGHKWPSKRLYCPFCENTDHETLRYFEIEDEEEYRVEVCEKCKCFLKTVDINKTSRTTYLPLESISTPYIDLKFQEMGYKSANIQIDK
ncbi:MAG TPA: formate dehydrogenase accessory protein FdhE [Spirochaetota bacterium]|nr:formate dehydrogenase accessory protein FdhE [Spirochaetota bacterium]HOD14136.1 formate dehydrogenase accessory protein FdhE [Spirochaetota bacterium]HPG49182.1 formate dehydrogenase accessory protein FdhE [Spirochaetota bacterium]HPN10767.1 formate dehydrogenase accessory protein FdhE [Spirochaetota bacterium]HQL81020.1 formate dehydrogenase accessory protein FdhE [Spirochaetota bacterium]